MISSTDVGGVVVPSPPPMRQPHVPDPSTNAGQDAPKPPAQNTNSYAVSLRVDEATHEVIAVILDTQTQKVIRQIPAEEMRTAANVIRSLLPSRVDTLA